MRSFVPWLIVVAALAAVAGGWALFARSEAQRYAAVERVARSASDIRLALTIDYARGPIAAERYRMSDLNGVSDASYAVTNRAGTTATFHEAGAGYDVSFFFDRLVADGIWDLTTKPARGRTDPRYTVTIDQRAGAERGGRTFSFTDPHYWATTAGRQFHIRLEKDRPVPDLLTLASTSIADPRYEKIVADFRAFGTPRFKRTVREARARLGLAP